MQRREQNLTQAVWYLCLRELLGREGMSNEMLIPARTVVPLSMFL